MKNSLGILSAVLLFALLVSALVGCANTDEIQNSDTEESQTQAPTETQRQTDKPLGERVPFDAEAQPLARIAATEGMVLLKNEDSVLPLTPEDNVALLGPALNHLVKGGTGSGDVSATKAVGLLAGMREKQNENKVTLNRKLTSAYIKSDYHPSLKDLKAARETSDIAVYAITRNAGEGSDRNAVAGDYYLSAGEIGTLDSLVTVGFERIVVVINSGGIVDTTKLLSYPQIKAILLAWQPGQYGGNAIADILVGDVSPCGKLADTLARSYNDYPSSKTFKESNAYVNYTEDIFVGYRYFETFDPDYETVNFEFGFGLSYTAFEYSDITFNADEEEIEVSVKVTNTGDFSGKESVQLYFSAPQGRLGKPAKELCAFAKTQTLAPGATETLTMKVNTDDLSSYDDTGKVKKSAYVIEAGEYRFLLGSSIRNVQEVGKYTVEDTVIAKQLSEQSPARLIEKRLLADGTYENIFSDHAVDVLTSRSDRVCADAPNTPISFEKLREHPEMMPEFLAQLTPTQLIEITYGHPATIGGGTGTVGFMYEYGVPAINTADGPAGLRLTKACTAWPVATLLACSWNTDLLAQIGEDIAREAKENGVDIWLAPAVNIHRDPLCGRNFEYYSEDPYLSGVMAAAITQTMQSSGVGVCVKHFVGNEKEGNRNNSDSRMSERALREIYLRPFEIAIDLSDPWMIMSSYNYLNGAETAESYSLLTEILRKEWGYKGVVCTDWGNNSSLLEELLAGNDVKMPGASEGNISEVLAVYENGTLSRAVLEDHAERIISLILKFDKKLDMGEDKSPISVSATEPTVMRSVDLVATNGGGTEKCEDVGGTLNTTNNDAGRVIYYKIDVAAGGEYQLKLRIASPEGKGAFDLYVDGEKTASFKITRPSGAWQTWMDDDCILSVTLGEGEHILKLAFTQSGMNFNTVTFIPVE